MAHQFIRVGDVLISTANVVYVYPYVKEREDGTYKAGIEILQPNGSTQKLLMGEVTASEESAFNYANTLISNAESVK